MPHLKSILIVYMILAYDHFIQNDTDDYPSDNFQTPRNTKDNVRYNNYGVALAELCCTHGIHALNGRLHDEKEGNFTCVTYNGASTVDYFLGTTELFPHFSNFSNFRERLIKPFSLVLYHWPTCCCLGSKK